MVSISSFTDLVNRIEDALGASGSRQMAEAIANAIRDGKFGKPPLYDEIWDEYWESIDPWAIAEEMGL
jgi:hypothetical protein